MESKIFVYLVLPKVNLNQIQNEWSTKQMYGICYNKTQSKVSKKTYTNPNDIKKYKKEKLVLREINTNTPKLRSKSHFDFKHHCLFCGNEATDSKKKDKNVFQVRTDDFDSRIQDACDLRNDDWAAEVRGRLESVSDLHAADAVYHQACSANFRTKACCYSFLIYFLRKTHQ
ncbi:unnamed protein product [Mytilus edulis]|uniref:Uncharacterized protein n=1 Tax=Mytilus edulis TaxID=6550 RepID=A0A8S3SJY5_MYTED|nr:unnamed protein product [Mytilus edulis]